MNRTQLADDPREWKADQLMQLLAEAVKAGDVEAVPHLITLLAIKDPHQAQQVYDGITAVLDAAKGPQ